VVRARKEEKGRHKCQISGKVIICSSYCSSFKHRCNKRLQNF